MNLRYDNERLTFIVDTMYTVGFEYKGASIASHKLAYELAELGNYVYIFNQPKYPHPNIKVIDIQMKNEDGGWWRSYSWPQLVFNTLRTITIYPQITWGNPLNTIHNTRWILHDTEEETFNTFGKDDLICNFGTFKIPSEIKQTKLTIFDYKFDDFYNLNNKKRRGFGHIIHKNTPDWGIEFFKNFGSTEVPHYNGTKDLNYLLDEFNKYEYILTFDDKSYYTCAAGLCGAKSIILNPNKEISPTEYRLNNPIQMCGVAYGFDDIKWADNTIGFVKENLSQLEKMNKQTVLNFVKYWEEKINE